MTDAPPASVATSANSTGCNDNDTDKDKDKDKDKDNDKVSNGNGNGNGNGNSNGNDDKVNNGKAGRTDYASWETKAASLARQLEQEERDERQRAADALGHDRGAPVSEAHADDMRKLAAAQETKRALDAHRRREEGTVQVLTDVLSSSSSSSSSSGRTRYVTRNDVDAFRRVVRIADTAGPGHIVLTQDLSHLSCAMPANAILTPRSYDGDAENEAAAAARDGTDGADGTPPTQTTVRGIIKLVLDSLENVTVSVRCKVITGTIELCRCSNVTVRIEKQATVATVQADLCDSLKIEFHDAPSGKNPSPLPLKPASDDDAAAAAPTTVFWGDDKNDRVYHAGVSNLTVAIYRDGYLESQCASDYLHLGATAIGNATPEEVQFVTSVLDGQLITEKIATAKDAAVISASTTDDAAPAASSSLSSASAPTKISHNETDATMVSGVGIGGARPLTEREVREERERQSKREKALEGMIRIEERSRNNATATTNNEHKEVIEPSADANVQGTDASSQAQQIDSRFDSKETETEVIEEVYTGMTRNVMDAITRECDVLKTKGNDAFGTGEYAQAALYYTLALDKAAELPDEDDVKMALSQMPLSRDAEIATSAIVQIYPRHVILSNRSASFLKLGQHDKALTDAERACVLDPTYVKALFRQGLALHALGRYGEALPVLGAASKLEPKNKQVRQALQFAEMRYDRELRERMM